MSACNSAAELEAEAMTKADVAPQAKPQSKLGAVLGSLDRRESLMIAARTAGLNPARDGLLVQIAYAGEASLLESALSDLGLVVLHRYPRYQRLDVLVRDFSELDAVASLGNVNRVQAMQTAISR